MIKSIEYLNIKNVCYIINYVAEYSVEVCCYIVHLLFPVQAKEWKCQPDKFLTPENERHEILLGSMNMLIGSTASGVIACYIMNGGTIIYMHAPSSTVFYRTVDFILIMQLFVESMYDFECVFKSLSR